MFELQMFTYFHFGHKCPQRCMNGKVIGKRTFNNITEDELKNLIPGPVFDLIGSGGSIKRNVATYNGDQGTIKIVSTIKEVLPMPRIVDSDIKSEV